MHVCQAELISDVHASAGEALQELGELRQAVAKTGAGILASGTHPSAAEDGALITDKERYERIRFLLADAVVTPAGGMHVHVGRPDAETAIRTVQRPAP